MTREEITIAVRSGDIDVYDMISRFLDVEAERDDFRAEVEMGRVEYAKLGRECDDLRARLAEERRLCSMAVAHQQEAQTKLAAAEAKGWRGVNGRIEAERDAALALADRLGKSVAALLNNPDGAIRHKGETYSARDWARAALAEWEAARR